MSGGAEIRPVAGVICCTREVGPETGQVVIDRYVRPIADYADASVLLIPTMAGAVAAADVAGRLDGLFLTGSPSNVEAWRYGEARAETSGPFDPDRDAAMLDLVRAMTAQGKPVFGVCRGLQELNVALGGTLRRDMASSPALLPHHAPEGASLEEMFAHRHPVSLVAGGVLAQGLRASSLEVNSVHYQGIDRLAGPLTAEAHAPDGVVEAVSGRVGRAEVLAVQWHPEWRTEGDASSQAFFRLFGDALRRARADASARTSA